MSTSSNLYQYSEGVCWIFFDVSFILEDVEGEAKYLLSNKNYKRPIRLSENKFVKLSPEEKSSRYDESIPSQTFDLLNKIMGAQGHALQPIGHLLNNDNLFPAQQATSLLSKKVSLNKSEETYPSNRIKDNRLHTDSDDKPCITFLSKQEVLRRTGLKNLDDVIGFRQDIEKTLLLKPTQYFNVGQISDFHLETSTPGEFIPISIKDMPVLRWAGVTSIPFSDYARDSRDVSRDFRWEIIFLGSNEVLASARWNDMDGIKALAENMSDTRGLQVAQSLLNPEFFK